MKTFLSRFLPVFLWAIVIFAFSANSDPYAALPQAWAGPENPVASAPPSADEIIGRFLHVGEYIILGLLMLRAVAWNSVIRPGNALLSAGYSMLYALSDEFHQSFVPGRAFQIADLMLDLMGILIGLAGYYVIKKNFEKKRIGNEG